MKNFTPQLLPPNIKINAEDYIDELVEAYGAVKEYKTVLKYLRMDRDILLHILYSREAVDSMNLVENKATVKEYFELSVEKNRNHEYLKEIQNYMDTLAKSKDLFSSLDFNERLFNRIHYYLTEGYEEPFRKGSYRTESNQVINKACDPTEGFMPPSAEKIDDLMKNFIEYLEANEDYHLLVKMAILHYQFESIHPYDDGNGRMSRILFPIFVNKLGLMDNPNLFISEAIGRNRCLYYENLEQIRKNKNWVPWIKYFLKMIETQAKMLMEFVLELERLYFQDYEKVENIMFNKYIGSIYKSIYKNPVFTINQIAQETGFNYQTVRKHLVTLEDDKIVSYNESSKGRVYYYDNLIEILSTRQLPEEPKAVESLEPYDIP
ncbi:Fic family protein [Dethiosulfatibacter aminovorans DSM 17477]|uniref:Fic family protein n=1 Tax=Dethiosulfatibacter aminovorans DSM 17477 TaxID=1121476 RepID=A0A1M6I1W5_9FIRM|nr:Fic family protein [Dethiosulfatibacter aminovorans]SHJ28400.1 Fic family protein [Dethiosulfatibacter aminovorans DSM 17477]